MASAARSDAQLAKAEAASALARALEEILNLHRPEFPDARRPIAPEPPAPDAETIAAKHRQAATAGIGVFNRRARNEAREAADRNARQEIAHIESMNRQMRQEYQAHLDGIWRRLVANEPDAVMGMLATAFEDNEAAAAPVGVTADEASIVVHVPAPDAVPERRPTTTQAGNLSLKKLTKKEAADFYKLMVYGYVLVTVKEALSVAPGLNHVRIVAVRTSGSDAYGQPRVEAILAARFDRQRLKGVRWAGVDASTVMRDVALEANARTVGPSKELAALDLSSEPELRALIDAFEIAE